MKDFKDLEVFIAVAKLLNFHDAAEALNTTQPAISDRIKRIEEYLGVSLLERKPVALTPKGEELLYHAKRLIRLREEAIKAVKGSTERGTMHLGVAETINHTWLPRLLARVNAAYPKLELVIDVNISPELLKYLVAKEVDLAFLVGPVSHPEVFSPYLCQFEMAFVASREMPFPDGPVELDQIVTKPLATFARNTKPYQDLQKLLEREGLSATIHASASLEAMVSMALDGHAIAFIPPAALDNKPDARRRLRRLNATVRLADLEFSVGWPDALDHPAARKVVEIAREVAAETPRSGLL